MSTTFRIEKAYLVGLANWLNEQQLDGRISRFRTRFVKDLSEAMQELDNERLDLAKNAADKDEDGNPLTEGEGAAEHFVVPVDNQPALNDAVAELMKEEFVVDVTEANKEKMQIVRDIVLNTDYKFGPKEGDDAMESFRKTRQANDYDVWCEAFEALDAN